MINQYNLPVMMCGGCAHEKGCKLIDKKNIVPIEGICNFCYENEEIYPTNCWEWPSAKND